MSGAQPSHPTASDPAAPGASVASGAQAGGPDPSMEDILASIRRILSDDEAEQAGSPAGSALPDPRPAPSTRLDPALPELPPMLPQPGHAGPSRQDAALDVLALDAGMIVDEPPQPPAREPPPKIAAPEPAAMPVTEMPTTPGSVPAAPGLVAPAAAAAATASVGSLLRTLDASREAMPVYRGGPTLEDLVREELRPLLKQWLDDQLPAMVERLVRVEIERVVGRAG